MASTIGIGEATTTGMEEATTTGIEEVLTTGMATTAGPEGVGSISTVSTTIGGIVNTTIGTSVGDSIIHPSCAS